MNNLTTEESLAWPSHVSAASKLLMLAPGPTRVEHAIEMAQTWLLDRQHALGYFCAPLEGDTTCESYMIMLEAFLGRGPSERTRRLGNAIRARVLPDGGFAQYPGGPPDISVSCLSYFALKLVGDSADAPHMASTRKLVLRLGGAQKANSYTQYHLALFGQCSWRSVPAIPPEMMLLPRQGPITIYDMSSWSRTIFVPLSILWAHKPVHSLPVERAASELFVLERNADSSRAHLRGRGKRALRQSLRALGARSAGDEGAALAAPRRAALRAGFYALDRVLKGYERVLGRRALRRRAIRAAADWMIARLHHSDGLSAILPAMCNSVMALHCLGYADDHPLMREQLAHLEGLLLAEPPDALRMQPCLSPVWDTVLSAHALVDSGLPAQDPRLRRAASWLLAKQTRERGDWAQRNPAPPGGWYFEYRNEFYPDVDDTSMALMFLARARAEPPEPEQQAAIERGLAWMLQMQNRDGGWAAFDRDCDKVFLTCVPFADHNAMIDPSSADITGRALECLSHFPSFDPTHPVVERALAFLRRQQSIDGSWGGRWGVNYIYGTWQVLRGMRAIGVDMRAPEIKRAVRWLQALQNRDGGWGESIASYADPSQKGRGPSTPSQTAWALMGLIAAHEADSQSVRRGVHHLLERQDSAGTWQQPEWTGTGFPKVFYLNYPLYRHHFPLLALAQYRRACARSA